MTSFTEFVETFGGFNSTSILPLSVYAFFTNGGSRAYIVRTLATDATTADLSLTQPVTREDTGVSGDASTGPFTFTLANTPLDPESVTVEVHETVTSETAVSGSADGATTDFSFTLANAPVIPNTVTISDSGSVASDLTDDGEGRLSGADGSGTINYTTGEVDLTYTTAPGTGADDLEADYRYLDQSFTDDGAGAFSDAFISSGTVDYETGEVSIETAASLAATAGFYSTYEYNLFEFTMQWPGAAGNDFRVTVQGSTGFEADSTASFSRYTVLIEEEEDDGSFSVVETFAELIFDDSTSADYIVDVINDDNTGSDLVTVTATGNNENPEELEGDQKTGENVIDISPGHDGTEVQHTYTMLYAVHPSTFSLTLSTGEIVEDDGSGNLALADDSGGSLTLDSTGTNSIDYDTGVATITWDSAPGAAVTATADYYAAPENDELNLDMTGGSDGSAVSRSVISSPALAADELGVFALNQSDELMQVLVPDFETDPTVSGDLVDYCEGRKDRFAILSVPEGLSPQEAVNYKKFDLAKNTSYAALYYPHVQVVDPLTERSINVPPGGHIAGIYARTDSNRNVGKAPAGKQDGQLRFLIGLERELTRNQVGTLNPNQINSLIAWQQVGRAVWGTRTLQTGGEFGLIPTRRLFMFLEKSVFNSTHQYVFEPNGPTLWARIRFQLVGFMTNLFRQGYFAGNSPGEAFFVVVDSSNNPQSSVDAGFLYVDVGVAPNTPAEFIVFRFQRKLNT